MMSIILILFALWPHVSPHGHLYSELEYLGGSCYPSDSCNPTRKETDDHLWGDHSCECGEHCIRYSTCCADSPQFGKTSYAPYRGETCKKLASVSHAVVMVSRCHNRWRSGIETLEKCLATDGDVEDPITMTPVTSLDTNVTYKNYFCAECNLDYRNIYFWNISVELNSKRTIPNLENITEHYLLENMVYNPEQKSWGLIADDDDFLKLNIRFKVPESLQKLVKKCYRNIVMTCDERYTNNNLQYKCWSYYSPIQIKEEGKHVKKYRNIHCAACNNVNVTESDMKSCKLDPHVPKTAKPKFSFALLLDINRDDGELVGIKTTFCENEQKWDPFFKKCRSLICAIPGYVVKNGRCVPDGAIEAKY